MCHFHNMSRRHTPIPLTILTKLSRKVNYEKVQAKREQKRFENHSPQQVESSYTPTPSVSSISKEKESCSVVTQQGGTITKFIFNDRLIS